MIAATVALATGAPIVAIWCVGAAVVLFMVTVGERERYGVPGDDTTGTPEPLRPTDEVFADPTTGQRMRVWFDPGTGRRVYRPDSTPGR